MIKLESNGMIYCGELQFWGSMHDSIIRYATGPQCKHFEGEVPTPRLNQNNARMRVSRHHSEGSNSLCNM